MREECPGAVGYGCHELIRRGEGRVGDVLVVKVYCVTEAITVCGLNMAAMCAVVFGGSTDVPPIDGVEGPCPA